MDMVNSYVLYSSVCDFGWIYKVYSKTCVRQPPLKWTLVVDVERWLSYKDTGHVLQNYMTCTFLQDRQLFPHQPLFKVSLEGGSLTQVLL